MPIIGLIGIIIALVLFLLLVYKGWSSYWVAPLCAVIVAVTNVIDTDPMNSAAQTLLARTGLDAVLNKTQLFQSAFINGMLDVAVQLFAIIFLGAILGKVFSDTGAASAIAKTLTNTFVIKRTGPKQVRAALLVLLVMAALCTMGGIDGYVLTFTMFPICLIVAEIVNIPRRFVPAMLALNCAFMTIPGAPQIYNVMGVAAAKMTGIPGTETLTFTSGLIPGLVSSLIIAVAGYFTLSSMVIKAMTKGEVFEYGPVAKIEEESRKLPNFWVAILPLVVVFVLFNALSATHAVDSSVVVTIALTAGILVNLILMYSFIPKKDAFHMPVESRFRGLITMINGGADRYPNALMTVVTPAGLAGVITVTAGFGMVVGILVGLPISPLVLTVIVTGIIVGLTSSPPAALMVVIPIMLGISAGIAQATGAMMTNPAHIMRTAIIAASTFETLPVNGLIILTIGLARTTHKQSYKPLFLMTVVYTLIGTLVAMGLFLLFPNLQ